MAAGHLPTAGGAAESLQMSHFAAIANPMLAQAVGQPTAMMPAAAGVNQGGSMSTGHPGAPSASATCSAVFIGHIGSDRDLKDLFGRYGYAQLLSCHFIHNFQ